MAKKRTCMVAAGIVPLVVVGVSLMFFWSRFSQAAARLWASWFMSEYKEPVNSDGRYTNIIFLHHSTGRNLILEGNVRPLLTERGYQFWDHDYNHIGLTMPDGRLAQANYRIPGMNGAGDTDVVGLAALFAQPDTTPPTNAFSRLLQHEVIIVKSCFPNSAIQDDAQLRQVQAWYLQMRAAMDAHPDHLFIIMTSPPLHPLATNADEAARARAVASWLASEEFLAGRANVVVFDFYGLLRDPHTNMLRADYQQSATEPDSHPNKLANETIGPLFVAFVDTAVQSFRQHRELP